jgi:hypothetical protein
MKNAKKRAVPFITEESFLQHMNITMKCSLINLIKIENNIQQIIKGPAGERES